MATPGTATDQEIVALLMKHGNDTTMMGCRPADWNDYPEASRPEALGIPFSDLDGGWIEETCELCGLTVHMGPRQVSHRITHGNDKFMVLDFLCVALIQGRLGETDQTITVRHLGGR